MSNTFFWYDFEATGIDPRRDRPLQVAGVRTDEDLNEIGEPLCIDCRLPEDVLPHPMACLITGIGPERASQGLPEAAFIGQLHAQMAEPGTCSVGYNSLRYDDEMTRFTLYRNYHDPYAREWQGGNSRWDLLDALRAAHALRPDGIEWPQQDGFTSLRLELLTQANGIDHGQAHDALADVRATIAMARCLKRAQPRLFDYLLDLRSKQRVTALVDLQQVRPLVHVSGRFGRERQGLALVLPLGWHPQNKNALIVWDLAADPAMLMDMTAEQLRERLYTRREDLPEGEQRPGLKLVHINKCPVLADTKVLRADDIQRLQLDMPTLLANAEKLGVWRSTGQSKLQAIYAAQTVAEPIQADPELQLYEGFIGDADRRILPLIREADGPMLAKTQWPLRDQRLVDMLLRYRARNFPASLNEAEQAQWQAYCRGRMSGEVAGAPVTLEAFLQAAEEALTHCIDPGQHALLGSWKEFALARCNALGVNAPSGMEG
ncbi:exodeoxyribonuclease I [Halopseudomonas laoshanensis]|uniref:Exodeoxyribonuclease I n=1 Tax=Halopseudomonas laoshanensis TaxID=2268758 RepID=A0A7V7GTE3_9GAMM|nr:exodeoxyribonuclease I [Halopseudomonas laoshanensis]KAA0694642.1 exodeoxyribonuclease I [Halopseudomonas laoshanensis]